MSSPKGNIIIYSQYLIFIFLGTNDLAAFRDATRTINNLKSMYELSLAKGIRPYAVTLPEIDLVCKQLFGCRSDTIFQEETTDWVSDVRLQVNKMIKYVFVGVKLCHTILGTIRL